MGLGVVGEAFRNHSKGGKNVMACSGFGSPFPPRKFADVPFGVAERGLKKPIVEVKN